MRPSSEAQKDHGQPIGPVVFAAAGAGEGQLEGPASAPQCRYPRVDMPA